MSQEPLPLPFSSESAFALLAEGGALIEGADALASVQTSYVLAAGDSFTGTFSFTADRDWLRINMTAGVAYVISLDSLDANVTLTLLNARGEWIDNDDDSGPGTNAQLVYIAPTSGTYYLVASRFIPSDGGATVVEAYTLTVDAQLGELADAAAGTQTAYTMEAGDTFYGRYDTDEDVDWVRVDLVAGTSYQFDLVIPYHDPFLYLADADGNVIYRAPPDPSPVAGLDSWALYWSSQMTYVATVSGTYYVGVTQGLVQNQRLVDYALTLTETVTQRVWTLDEMVYQLRDGYWGDDPLPRVGARTGEATSVNLTALTPEMQELARGALQAWADSTGLIFVETDGAARINFTADAGAPGPEAFTQHTMDGRIAVSARINIDQEWLETYGSSPASYTFQTLLSEIGRALGLGNPGDYDRDSVYGIDNAALNDSWQISVMSYFDQIQNTYVDATRAYALTPMIADIFAIASIYGTPQTLRGTNTTYGENSTAGGSYDLFSATNTDADEATTVAMVIIDTGGIDTLDFRSDTFRQRIDLGRNARSDVYGDIGTLTIPAGTIIENVLAGRNNDTLIGNDADNRLSGNDGHDSILAGDGNDWLFGGAGSDYLDGGGGNDTASFVDAPQRAVIDIGPVGRAQIGDEVDNLNSIENVTGTIYADHITGNLGANRLRGLGDYDWMVGSGGNDTFEGGTGRDTVAYTAIGTATPGGVIASLLTGTGTGGQAAGDRYIDIENLTGSSYNDRLTGDNDRNALRGLAGDDFIFGLNGADTIDGGAGRDSIEGGLGNDRITGGRGNDTIDGGAGWDTALYAGTRAQYTVTALADGRFSVLNNDGGLDGLDILTNVEVLEFADGRIYL